MAGEHPVIGKRATVARTWDDAGERLTGPPVDVTIVALNDRPPLGALVLTDAGRLVWTLVDEVQVHGLRERANRAERFADATSTLRLIADRLEALEGPVRGPLLEAFEAAREWRVREERRDVR